MKKFHQLITEFIVMMSNTVDEIRKKSYEIADKHLIDNKVIYAKNILSEFILLNKLHF